MDFETFRNLQAQRPALRQSWERLLRIEKTTSPLANPDALVHLLDTTLDEIFRDLAWRSPRRHPSPAFVAECPCGRNPLLAYYAAGRQALREALVGAQAANPGLAVQARDQDLKVLNEVFDQIARREIESFCGICQFREPAHGEARHRADRLAEAGNAAHCSRSR